jgi:drug/metabolite transporter (DMT)-like permease
LRTPVLLGVLTSLLSIVSYGISQVVTKSLVSGAASPQVGAAITLATGTVVLFFVSVRSLGRDLRAPRRSLMWVGLAGLLASNGAMLSLIAQAKAPLTVVSPILAVNPLMTLVLTAIFLRQVERVTMRVVLGSLLVIGGVVLVILGN